MYIPQDIEEEGKRFLVEKGYKIKVGSDLSQKILIEEIKGCDAVLTRSTAVINKEVITAAENLKVIAKYGVGLDNIDIEAATERGIYVTNTPEANANSVAEHVMALILSLSKNLSLADKELRSGNFAIRSQLFGIDLEGKTLGIIGLGRIGRILAKKASKGFDMKVIGYDPYVTASTNSELEIATDLEWVFRNSDVISLHLPLTKTTKGIIGCREFSWMKEADLVNALQAGEIAGAGIDVFEVEPPDKWNPLFNLDNVIVSPHNAALTKEGSIRMSVHAAMQVEQVLSGVKPNWAVNEPLTKGLSM